VTAIATVIRRELLVFSRYPNWILSMVIWPVLFPLVYLLGSRARGAQGGRRAFVPPEACAGQVPRA
jgi:hypothetical protein